MSIGFLSATIPERTEEEAALEGAVSASHLVSVYPVIKQQFTAMERALDNQMMTALHKRTSTPDDALRAWQEKGIYRRILSRLEQQIRAAGLDVPTT